MRKSLLVVFTVLMFCAFSAFAQSMGSSSPAATSPSAQGSNSNQSSPGMTGSQGSTSPGASQSQSSSTASGNSGEQAMEGCIVREQTDYYIQPSGGPPTKLSGSQDVASHVGHHVVVHGSQQSSSASNTSSSGSSASSGQTSSSGTNTFNVTKVDMIATNCPASMQPNSGSSQGSTNPK